jgi:hypothetical protein
MIVRDCLNQAQEFYNSLGLSSVYKSKYGGYVVQFMDCTLVEAKGHDRIKNVCKPRQARSDDRIRRYGNFGTSI